MSTCRTCETPPICMEDLDRYSLQEDTYFFYLNCPPGYVCSGHDVAYLVCCDGDILQVIFPIGATDIEKETRIQAMAAECLRRNCLGTVLVPDSDNPLPPTLPPGFPGTPPGPGWNPWVWNNPPTGPNPNNPGNPPTDYIPWNRDHPGNLYYNEPQSCTAYCPDGTPFTFTVPAGMFIAFDLATANAQAKAYACQQAPLMIICLGGFTACACVGSSFNGSIGITSANPPFHASVVAGTFPPGLHVSTAGNSVIISGTPATAGTFNFTIRVSDPHGNSNIRSYSMSVMRITTTTLPNYTVGTAYSLQLTAAGGSGNYAWRIYSGTLPDGLTLSTTGLISGTPTGLTSGGTVVFEVIDTACEVATRAFYTPRVSLVPLATTRLLTKRGWPEFVPTTGALYRTITFSGEATQTAQTTSNWQQAAVDMGGSRWVYSGASAIDIYGRFTSHHKKDVYVACNNAASRPIIISSSNVPLFIGYCYSADPASCGSCPTLVANYTYDSDWATEDQYDEPMILENPAGWTKAQTSATHAGGQDLVVALNDTAAPKMFLNGQYQTWILIHAVWNRTIVLSDEYTDADALNSASIYSNASPTADNSPSNMTWVHDSVVNVQSRTTTVTFSIKCLNLVAGQSYTVTYDLTDSDGTVTHGTSVFTAANTSHIVTGTVPTPAAGHLITISNPRISYT